MLLNYIRGKYAGWLMIYSPIIIWVGRCTPITVSNSSRSITKRMDGVLWGGILSRLWSTWSEMTERSDKRSLTKFSRPPTQKQNWGAFVPQNPSIKVKKESFSPLLPRKRRTRRLLVLLSSIDSVTMMAGRYQWRRGWKPNPVAIFIDKRVVRISKSYFVRINCHNLSIRPTKR